jgi:predicted Zn-dependent peptidase
MAIYNDSMRKRALALLFAALAWGQDLAQFEKRVTEFTLANGLHFIVLRRPEAPVVSFHTYVNAGSVDDSNGRTGIAHMFEHMAFKGTEGIGSKNITLEKKALAKIESVYDELQQERRKGKRADAKRIEELQAALKDAIASADSYVDSELYTRIMEDNGAVGLNASTGVDQTQYFLSYPSNRLELWFLMEADRFRKPVFREFYKERDVVREEKRMRSESSPQGELVDALLAAAFQGHPYKTSPAGFASDIENYRVADAKAFRDTYYVPSNMTIAIAGDVDPAEARRLAEKYFGPIPKGPLPPTVITVEPKQNGERRVEIVSAAQPLLLIAYKRPENTHADDPVFDVIDGILSGGRTGRIYKDIVEKRQLALAAASAASFPGGKYPNLYLLYALPNAGKTVAEVEKAIYEQVEALKKTPVDETTLKRVKTKVRASLIRQLASNSGLAEQMTFYHANYGDWRVLFRGVEEIEKVTAADVQRVAQKYFIDTARTVAYHVKPAEGAAQ